MICREQHLQDARYQHLIFSNYHENSQIESLLQGQKYHERLSLRITLDDQSKIALIGQILSTLNHLNGLHLIFNENTIIEENSLVCLLRALISFQNLKDLKLEIHHQDKALNYKTVIIEFTSLFNSFSKLEKLEIFFRDCIHYNSSMQSNLNLAFQNLKSLKELKFKISYSINYPQVCIQENLDSINQIGSLVLLECRFSSYHGHWSKKDLQWQFENLKNLQELHLSSDFCEISSSRLSEQLKYLQKLIKLELLVVCFNYNEINTLLNTILNLNCLEYLSISLTVRNTNSSITIGEVVCKESLLKELKFSLISQDYDSSSYGILTFGEQIVNIKYLEKLSLHFQCYLISIESFQVLSAWKNEWKHLSDFTFINSPNYREQSYLFEFLRECFSHTKTLTKLSTNFNFNKDSDMNTFLSGLAQLTNLETLCCQNDVNGTVSNFQKSYLYCFQHLQHLRELRFYMIENQREALFFAETLQFMSGLFILQVKLQNIQNTQHFEIFCQNLPYLKNLKQLYLTTQDYFTGMNEQNLNVEDTQVLFQGLLSLKNLTELDLLCKTDSDAKETFNKELCSLLKVLHSLVILKLRKEYAIEQKNHIIRHSLRLIKLTY